VTQAARELYRSIPPGTHVPTDRPNPGSCSLGRPLLFIAVFAPLSVCRHTRTHGQQVTQDL
jgi:hypothetical protein